MRLPLTLVLTFILIVPPQASAELARPGSTERKFQRGILNTVFAPVEISKALEDVKRKDRWVPTWIPGLFAGAVYMLARAVTGIYEIVTAPIPAPPKRRPILKPEFALEHIGILKEEPQPEPLPA